MRRRDEEQVSNGVNCTISRMKTWLVNSMEWIDTTTEDQFIKGVKKMFKFKIGDFVCNTENEVMQVVSRTINGENEYKLFQIQTIL